ncbi:MAG: hypothetical protein ACQER7_06660, partial [Bacteroidota bacterium]
MQTRPSYTDYIPVYNVYPAVSRGVEPRRGSTASIKYRYMLLKLVFLPLEPFRVHHGHIVPGLGQNQQAVFCGQLIAV